MTPTPGDSSDVTSPAGSRGEPEVEEAYDRIVDEGHERLSRPLLPLLSTGFLGGVDVGVGVLGYLVVDGETGQPLLGGLAFTIGFVALLLSRSELFTENFLLPVTAVVARAGTMRELVRLWVVTLAANLAAGFVMALLTVVALPDVRASAVRVGTHYARLGVSWRSFCLAVLAGAVIALLTRLQHATDQLGVKLVPAVALSFVLVAGQLFHSVLDSVFMFAGLLSGGWRLQLRRLDRSPGLVGFRQHRGRRRAGDLRTPAAGAAPRAGIPRRARMTFVTCPVRR